MIQCRISVDLTSLDGWAAILGPTFSLYRFNRTSRDVFYHDRVRLWLLRMNNEYIMILGTKELYIFPSFSSLWAVNGPKDHLPLGWSDVTICEGHVVIRVLFLNTWSNSLGTLRFSFCLLLTLETTTRLFYHFNSGLSDIIRLGAGISLRRSWLSGHHTFQWGTRGRSYPTR